MVDYKNNLVNEFQTLMADSPDCEIAVKNLIKVLMNYDVSENTTALTLYNDKDDRLIKRFVATKRLENKSEQTIKRYVREIETMRSNQYIDVPIDEITTNHLRLYLMDRKETCSNRTLNGIHRILSSFFGWLFNEGLITKNPVATLSSIKFSNLEEAPFSSTDIVLIREACQTKRDAALVEFLIRTGCRVSEIVRLNRTDIDFNHKMFTVLGKGNKYRKIYFDDVCCMKLQAYLQERTDNNDALFIGRTGTRLEDSGIQAALKRIELRSGVPNIHPHRFRHTYTSTMLDQNMNIVEVACLLGHSNIATTQNYAHANKARTERDYRNVIFN